MDFNFCLAARSVAGPEKLHIQFLKRYEDLDDILLIQPIFGVDDEIGKENRRDD